MKGETIFIPDDWSPTAENINALPGPLKSYIHDLSTVADPAYLIQQWRLTMDENKQLRAKIKELQKDN